jgi:hypothetical protein
MAFSHAEMVQKIAGVLQAAEKLIRKRVLYQGTSLLVPQMPQNQSGLQPLPGISLQFTRQLSLFPQAV